MKLKKEITEVKTDLKKDIAEVKAEFNKATEGLDFKVRQVTKINEKTEMVMQYRAIENYLRFRAIEEQDDKVIENG